MQTHPDLQLILYISGSGGLLERMAACNPDIISIDQAVDMRDAIKRIGPSFAVQVPPPPRAGGMSGFLAGKSAQEPTVPHIWLATSIRKPRRLSPCCAPYQTAGVLTYMRLQGNMDPGVLFGSKDVIEQRVLDTVRAAQGTRHVMNLGHGVLVGTPEENVAHFFEVARTVHERL
jgi:uroporphyrinogen-III decarboxylase